MNNDKIQALDLELLKDEVNREEYTAMVKLLGRARTAQELLEKQIAESELKMLICKSQVRRQRALLKAIASRPELID